jgi:hypothetical protein
MTSTQDCKIIAGNILQQLGGIRFIGMTGSKHFTAIDNPGGLQFSFSGCKKANKCRITLTEMDTYKVEFFKISMSDIEKSMVPVETYGMVYCDQLQDIFTSFTGLDTRI